jgi:bla regulator protein blaR1
MALNGNQHYLLNRVRRMLTLENKKLNLMEKTVLLLSIIGFTAFGFITNKISAGTDPVVSVESNITRPAKTEIEKTVRPAHLLKEPGVRKKKAINPWVFKSVADTVPKPAAKRSFPKISSNTNSDGNSLLSEIEATDNEGKVYRIKRVDGQLTELRVNGNAIPQSQYGDYDEVLRQIDQTQRGGSLRWKVAVQPKKADATVKRKEAFQQKTADVKRDQLVIERKLENELAKQIHLKKLEERKWVLQKNQNKMEYNQLKAGTLQKEIARSYKASESMQKARVQFQKKKVAPLEPKMWTVRLKGNDDVNRILSDLTNHKLVADADNFSFSLNDTELIVNGTKQSSELHQEFKKKYIQKSSDRFNYSKKGNATSININKE